MPLKLSAIDEELLAGHRGEAVRMAMSIVVQMAEIEGAETLLDVTRAHIDGALYMGESSLDFAEAFADLGARVAVPTTMNIGPMDEQGWRDFPVPESFAEKGARIMAAYLRMGCQATWSCAPYQVGARPALGEQIAWAESNAIVFANSVLGARTNRYGDYIDLCAALTGRVPLSGLHITENRRGQVLFRLTSLPPSLMAEEIFFPVLGYYLGERAGWRIPVVEGLPLDTTEDQLKAMGAAAASSGRVALFHAVGVTPEAPTLEAAFQGREPEAVVEVSYEELRAVWKGLSTAPGEQLDAVALGCPHFSLEEFARLARLVEGRQRHPGVEVVVTTSRQVRELARGSPFWPWLERFGVRVVVDSCILHMPVLSSNARVVMTNSGKYAHYIPGLLGRDVIFGSLEECVESAVRGRVVRHGQLWPGRAEERADVGNDSAPWRAPGREEPPVPPGLDSQPSVPRTLDRPLMLRGRALVAGSASGVALVGRQPLSFWGGLDAATGEVIDRRHDLSGQIVAGRVLAIPYSRGSSTTSTVLLEAIRAGTAPSAIVAAASDPMLALGSIVAGELYHRRVPVVALEEGEFGLLRTGDMLAIHPDGTVEVRAAIP